MTRQKSFRLWPAFITLFSLLAGHGPGHAQDAAALPLPLVVTLDDVRLNKSGVADDAVTGQAIRDCMTASGANLVLRRAAIRASSENADITDQVIARVKGAPGDCLAAKAFAPRLEALDIPAAKKFGETQDETAIINAATRWMNDSKANLVLEKQAIVIANNAAADITGNVIATITHKPAEAAARPIEGHVMVISRTAIMQYSKAGQDISRQVQAYTDNAKQELRQRGAELEKKGKALQDALPKLSRDEKALRFTVFKEESEALQAVVRAKDAQIRSDFETARHVMEEALGPLLMKLTKERGADLVLDIDATSAGVPGLDVTGEAIEKLDAVLSSVPVTWTDKPASGRGN